MEDLQNVYTANDRPDMVDSASALLERYSSVSQAFVELVTAKYALKAQLSAVAKARPFDPSGSATSEPEAKRPKLVLSPAATFDQKQATSALGVTEAVEIRIKDHHGKQRTTKVKGGTSIAEIIEWYGPRGRPAHMLDKGTGNKISSETLIRKIYSHGDPQLELEIVESRR